MLCEDCDHYLKLTRLHGYPRYLYYCTATDLSQPNFVTRNEPKYAHCSEINKDGQCSKFLKRRTLCERFGQLFRF
jgi:hypothetical protein